LRAAAGLDIGLQVAECAALSCEASEAVTRQCSFRSQELSRNRDGERMLAKRTERPFAAMVFAAALSVAVALIAGVPVVAQGPRDFDDWRPPPREFRGGGPGQPPFSRGYDGPTEATVKRGFVFVDGEYLAPPYEIRYADGKLSVNGRELTCLPPQRPFGGRGFGPGRGNEPSWRFMMNELPSHLGNQGVVLSFKDQPYWAPDSATSYELLMSMTTEKNRSLRQVEVMNRLPEDFDKQVWDAWIRDFTPPEDLRQRAALMIASFDTTQREAEAEIRATQWMNRLLYPMTIASMVLTVLSIGHLLGGRPHANKPTFGLDATPEMIHALNWSLFFAAAFSSIDLTWTILAANTNQMRELNPIGIHLIENPRHLAGFKIGITFSCLAVLWLLRKHKRAQIAAWWICLILTLVTIRWLTFNSLFVSA
jgi:uncharacterized protein YeaO (DUF488 family)